MFCSRCGAQIEQNSSFCYNCGASINTAPQAPVQQVPPQQPVYQAPPAQTYQQPVYQQPVYQQPVYQTPAQTYQQPAGPALTEASAAQNAVQKICGSPLFLIAVICYTLFQLYYLFEGSFTGWLAYEAWNFLELFGAGYIDIVNLHYKLDFATKIGVLLNLVIVAGLWVTFISARAKKNSTVGLTMIKVIAIIEMIGIILYIFISGIPAVMAIMGLGDYGYYYDYDSVMALLLYLVAGEGLTALVVVFFIKILTTLGAVKNAVRNGVPNRKISVFVAIVCFAIGAIIALDVVTSIIDMTGYLEMLPVRSWLSLFLSLVCAGVHFLVGILIFQYRGQMSKAEQAAVESQLSM